MNFISQSPYNLTVRLFSNTPHEISGVLKISMTEGGVRKMYLRFLFGVHFSLRHHSLICNRVYGRGR